MTMLRAGRRPAAWPQQTADGLAAQEQDALVALLFHGVTLRMLAPLVARQRPQGRGVGVACRRCRTKTPLSHQQPSGGNHIRTALVGQGTGAAHRTGAATIVGPSSGSGRCSKLLVGLAQTAQVVTQKDAAARVLHDLRRLVMNAVIRQVLAHRHDVEVRRQVLPRSH